MSLGTSLVSVTSTEGRVTFGAIFLQGTPRRVGEQGSTGVSLGKNSTPRSEGESGGRHRSVPVSPEDEEKKSGTEPTIQDR